MPSLRVRMFKFKLQFFQCVPFSFVHVIPFTPTCESQYLMWYQNKITKVCFENLIPFNFMPFLHTEHQSRCSENGDFQARVIGFAAKYSIFGSRRCFTGRYVRACHATTRSGNFRSNGDMRSLSIFSERTNNNNNKFPLFSFYFS